MCISMCNIKAASSPSSSSPSSSTKLPSRSRLVNSLTATRLPHNLQPFTVHHSPPLPHDCAHFNHLSSISRYHGISDHSIVHSQRQLSKRYARCIFSYTTIKLHPLVQLKWKWKWKWKNIKRPRRPKYRYQLNSPLDCFFSLFFFIFLSILISSFAFPSLLLFQTFLSFFHQSCRVLHSLHLIRQSRENHCCQ